MPAAGQTLSDRWPADEALSLLLVLRRCREVGSPKAPVTGSPPRELLPLRAAGQLAKRPGNWTRLGGRTGCRGAGAEPDPWNKPPSVPCTMGGDVSWGLTLRDLIPAWRGPPLLMGTLRVHPHRCEWARTSQAAFGGSKGLCTSRHQVSIPLISPSNDPLFDPTVDTCPRRSRHSERTTPEGDVTENVDGTAGPAGSERKLAYPRLGPRYAGDSMGRSSEAGRGRACNKRAFDRSGITAASTPR